MPGSPAQLHVPVAVHLIGLRKGPRLVPVAQARLAVVLCGAQDAPEADRLPQDVAVLVLTPGAPFAPHAVRGVEDAVGRQASRLRGRLDPRFWTPLRPILDILDLF